MRKNVRLLEAVHPNSLSNSHSFILSNENRFIVIFLMNKMQAGGGKGQNKKKY